ncbi:hypothetical protein StoSoilB13_07380 [Arthrobacter sp. StoSoilB13]|nr:hypothetical protein StoSoilB13_07380 [Arthrobacter sp. StoSoilB13]
MDEATAGAGAEQDGLTPVKPAEAELLVVTGMSGAGRSTASDALEDHGWYVVDNLPPQMLGTLAEIVSHAPKSIPKLAVVVDVRSKDLFTDIQTALGGLERHRHHVPGVVPRCQRRSPGPPVRTRPAAASAAGRGTDP